MENIFVEFLPPWVETGLQPAFYDKESGTVLQQTARMYARVNMLIRMFNRLSKNTKETVDHYIEEFTTLYNYVHDYFDNLDVQEEINNKLDAMVEAGTLQEIIDSYLNSIALFGFDNVASMVSSQNLVSGSFARTLGYTTKNDNGGALYSIEPMEDSITIDNGEYIALTDPELVAHLVPDNDVNIKQFGAVGDDTTDDTDAINNAIDYCNNNHIKLFVPEGTYLVSDTLHKLLTGFSLYGVDRYKSTIHLVTDQNISLIKTDYQTSINIHDLGFEGNSYTQGVIYNDYTHQIKAIDTERCYYSTFENLLITGFFNGFGNGYYSWGITIRNCEVYYCTNGILASGGESNSYSIISTSVEYCDQAIRISAGYGNHILSSTIQRSTYGISLIGTKGSTVDNNYFEANATDLRVEDGSGLPSGTVVFSNNYILTTETTNRLKISTNNSYSIVYVDKNTFRAGVNLASGEVLGFSNSTNKMYVAFTDNLVESPITIGQSGNVNVKVNDTQKGKNIATAWLGSNYSIVATNTFESLTLDKSKVVGNNITISSGKINVARNSNVRITGKVGFGTITSGSKFVAINVNGTRIANTNVELSGKGEATIPPIVYNAGAGAVISLDVFGTASDAVVGSASTMTTYLTVEEL